MNGRPYTAEEIAYVTDAKFKGIKSKFIAAKIGRSESSIKALWGRITEHMRTAVKYEVATGSDGVNVVDDIRRRSALFACRAPFSSYSNVDGINAAIVKLGKIHRVAVAKVK